jgi:hypothetical protein
MHLKHYFLCTTIQVTLPLLYILRNIINVVWNKEIMNWFTKLFFIYDMKKINWSLKEDRVINS